MMTAPGDGRAFPPRLIRESELDAQIVARVKALSADADLLGFMRRLLADSEAQFDAGAAELRAISGDSFGRKVIRSVVTEIDRAARNKAYASRAPNGLSQAIDHVIRVWGGTFTGTDVYQKLRSDGYRFAAKRPRQACYHALQTLIDAGRVSVHTPGRRGVAVRYIRPSSPQLPLDLPADQSPNHERNTLEPQPQI